jgi:hypothetical protein
MELVGGEDLSGVELACNAVLGSVELAHNMELGGAQKTTPHDPHGVGWWRTEGGVGAWRRRKARVGATAAAHKGCFFLSWHTEDVGFSTDALGVHCCNNGDVLMKHAWITIETC